MPEMQIKRSDIESLAQKLGSPDPQLSDDERAMLSTVLAAAAEALGDEGPVTGSGTRRSALVAGLAALLLAAPIAAGPAVEDHSVASLRAQFASAFTPGAMMPPGEGDPNIQLGPLTEPRA
jgi:hypothetical protein